MQFDITTIYNLYLVFINYSKNIFPSLENAFLKLRQKHSGLVHCFSTGSI